MRLRRAKLQAFQSLLVILSLFAAYSAQAATIHVPADQPTIQAGINAAAPGDTVLVAPGTYYENIDFKGKAITVTSSGGAATTIIDGSSTAPAVTFKSNEPATAVLSQFTIQHGGNYSSNLLGGIYVFNSAPTILNNVITKNNCWGIQASTAAPFISGNEISATQSPQNGCGFGGGAGIYIGGNLNGNNPAVIGTPPVITGNIIENNVLSGLADAGGNGGAGIAVWGGSPIIENNVIRNNSSPGGSGGAINFVYGFGITIIQNLIYGNQAGCGGGAIAFDGGNPASNIHILIANNTIVDNTGQSTAGYSECTSISQIYPSPGTYGSSGPNAVIINNIIGGSTAAPAVNCSWFGPPSESTQPTFQNNILYNTGGPFFGSYCIDVSGKYNNIVADPQFVSPSTGDYHLKSTSPAIDHGQNSVQQTILTMTGKNFSADFDGNPRVQAANSTVCTIDIGAYEYPGTQSVCSTTETLQSSLNPSTFGQTVTFTAQLSSMNGVPTGNVQFTDGSTILGTSAVSGTGVATFSASFLAIGSHTITATYQPTGSFPVTNASLVEVVNGYPTATNVTSSLNPGTYSQPITFTATVTSTTSGSGSPTGTISFTDGSTLLATQTLTPTGTYTAAASFVTSTLSVGTHTITATYVSAGAFAGSTGALTQTVVGLPTTTTLTAAPSTAYAGQPIALTASTTTTGSTTIPTGIYTFYDGSTVLATSTLVNGAATFSTTTLTADSHSITAVYSGDSTFKTSTSNSTVVTIQLNPTATTLTLAPNPAVAFQRFGPTIQVKSLSSVPFSPSSCSPACTVTINITGLPPNIPSTITSQIPPSGIISINGDAFAAGTYTFTATFNGSAAFAASSAPSVQETITVAPTTLTLSASPNPATQTQTVTFTSILTAPLSIEAPGGTITFFDGATPFATAPFSANVLGNTITATASTTTLAAGTHTITANYPGNVNFLPVTSAPVTLTINPSDFTLTVEPSITIQAEHHATTPLTLTSLGSLTGPVSLTCSNLPIWTTCTFTPSTAQLTSGSTATASLYLDTDAVIGYARNTPTTPKNGARSTITLALLLPAALLFTLRRKLRIPTRLVLLALATLAGALTISGCSGKYPPHTTPGAYNITVTGTGPGGLVHTANITLNVTP